MDNTHHFKWPDYLVFGLTVLVSLGIGIFHALTGSKRKTTSDFLLAGRNMSFLPVAISLLVSFESAITILGMPAEGYMYGLQIWLAYIPNILVKIMIAWVVAPLLHSLNVTSAYEYLELRFKSRAVRLLGSIYGILYELIYMGVVLFGPAVALEAVTGFSSWMSITGLAVVAVIYTAIGGLKAVIWTDVFQALIMVVGILAVLIKGTISAGGPEAVWDAAAKGGRTKIFDFSLDPTMRLSFWSLTVSSVLHSFSQVYKQTTIQRFSSIDSITKARRIFFFVAPAYSLISMIAYYEGVVIYAYFVNRKCDPFVDGTMKNPNQIVPYTVLDMFGSHSGMPGLFLASLFSASLSTLSSNLSSLSAMITIDFVRPLTGEISEWKATIIAKLVVVLCGALAIGLAWMCSTIGGTLNQLSYIVLSVVSAPSTSLFLMASFSSRANKKGAIIGAIIGTIVVTWMAAGRSFTPGLKKAPTLPPASTASCEASPLTFNETYSWLANGKTMWERTANQTTASMLNVASIIAQPESPENEMHGLNYFYSLSYRYIFPISLIVSLLSGYVASILTGGNKPGEVDPRYMVDLSAYCCYWLPGSIRRRWKPTSNIGVSIDEYVRPVSVLPQSPDQSIELVQAQKEVEPLVYNA